MAAFLCEDNKWYILHDLIGLLVSRSGYKRLFFTTNLYQNLCYLLTRNSIGEHSNFHCSEQNISAVLLTISILEILYLNRDEHKVSERYCVNIPKLYDNYLHNSGMFIES